MQSICKEKRRNLFCVSFHFVGKITNKCKHQNVEVKCSNSQIKRKITHCFTAIKCCLIKSNNWINTQRKNLQLFGEWMRARNIYIWNKLSSVLLMKKKTQKENSLELLAIFLSNTSQQKEPKSFNTTLHRCYFLCFYFTSNQYLILAIVGSNSRLR